LEKNLFCIDLSKYRLMKFFWNSLPMIFNTMSWSMVVESHHET